MTSAREEERLLLAMIERPDDEALGRVYADWLEERGDPRARYFREVLLRAYGGDRRPESLVYCCFERMVMRGGEMWHEERDGWVWTKARGPGHKASAAGPRLPWGERRRGLKEEVLPLEVRAALVYRHWPREAFLPGINGVGIYSQGMAKRPWCYCYLCKNRRYQDGRQEYVPQTDRMTKRDAEAKARREAEWHLVEYVGVIEVPWEWMPGLGRPMV